MSQNKQIKSSIFKYHTKSKKIKQRFLFDLDDIDKQENIIQSSLDKTEKEKENKNDKNEKISDMDNLEIIPLKNIYGIYSAWKSSNLIFENFEKKILDKKNFEIDYETLEIRTKNEKACKELRNEKFWILYCEYLKRNNKIKNYEDFIKIINLAFSYVDFQSKLLLVYFLDKIKKYNPIIKEGKIVEKDGPYIDLLEAQVKNKINNLKENLSSNIKIKHNTYQKEMNNLNYFDEFTPIRKKSRK